MSRILVFAPNWLGDAVMALPSVAAIRAQFAAGRLAVAARGHLAGLYEMASGVDEVVCLGPAGRFGGWASALRDARRLRAQRFDVAILLPNSFRAAWIARRAGIGERWGYATDARAALLTRAIPRVRGVHQVEYYRRLVEQLALTQSSGVRPSTTEFTRSGRGEPVEPRGPRSEVDSADEASDVGRRTSDLGLQVPQAARDWARQSLAAAGWKPGERLVGMAPGAAYGGAKQWPPERFARLAMALGGHPSTSLRAGGGPPLRGLDMPIRTVVVGSAGDRAACEMVTASDFAINLCGRTDLAQLAAVIAECRAFVSNDSGAMHLAAAVGVPVVAIFGSTNEHETAPLGEHVIVKTDVPCRPCMLRECPIEGHPCMEGIDVERVRDEVVKAVVSSE